MLFYSFSEKHDFVCLIEKHDFFFYFTILTENYFVIFRGLDTAVRTRKCDFAFLAVILRFWKNNVFAVLVE